MKRPHSAPDRGFTLIELLVAVALIALLLALAWLAMETAFNRSREKQTVTLIRDVQRAIEDYKDDHNHYPRPAREEETVALKNEPWAAGGAKMLYQVLSGDGTDAIKNLPAGDRVIPSTGQQGSAQEEDNLLAGKVYMDTIAAPTPGMVRDKKLAANVDRAPDETFYVVDGWRHPLQYHRQQQDKQGPISNTTQFSLPSFEIWSYGKLKKPADSAEDRKKWITNGGRE